MQDSSPSDQLLANRYQIVELIGHGGMASVYRAHDHHLHRTVAVKIIHPHLADQPNFLQRFEAEAVLVARLRHPHIVEVYDFIHAGDQYFMVMEFIEGETLESRLKRLVASGQRLPVEEAFRIAIDLCQALEYAHQRGLVHRDIKPANVMLDSQGRVILMDFGVARLLGGQMHTATGAVLGTAVYMAPEQIQGQKVDGRADIYALGGTLFQMLSNHPPFEADSAITLMMKHVNEPPPDVRQFQPSAPPQATAILYKALAKLPEHRYQTAQAMAQALQHALSGAPLPPAAAEQPADARLLDATFLESPAPPGSFHPPLEPPARSATASSTRPGRSMPPSDQFVQPAAASNARPEPVYPGGLDRQAALDALSASQPPSAIRRYPAWLIPLALVILLAIAAGAYALLRPRPSQPAALPATATLLLPSTDTPLATAPLALLTHPATATLLPPTATFPATETLALPTPTLPPASTDTPLPPSSTPTPVPAQPSGINAGCIDGLVWFPYKKQNITQDASGCWDLSHWGVVAEGDTLHFASTNQTNDDSYRGIYTPINPLLSPGTSRAVLRLKLQVDQLSLDPPRSLGLAIGVGKADTWQYYGWFATFRPSLTDPASLQLYATSNIQQTGQAVQSLTRTGAHTIEVTFEDYTVLLRVDDKLAGSATTIPSNMLPEPVFWIGFSLPPYGTLDALLTEIEFPAQ